MKRTQRQLVLSRETIRPLGKLELGHVAGAVIDSKGANIPITCGCPPGQTGDDPGPTTRPQ